MPNYVMSILPYNMCDKYKEQAYLILLLSREEREEEESS